MQSIMSVLSKVMYVTQHDSMIERAALFDK